MASTCVNVWIGKERKSAIAIPTDKDGLASFQLTDNDAATNTQKQWKQCGLFGVIDPVVKYADSIGINVGYVLCQVRQPDHTWLVTQSLSTEEVLKSGIVTANTCGKATSSPAPGEIVLFVRPLTWLERLKE